MNATEQRFAALEIANAIRTHNAQLKIGIAAGSVDPVQIICERSEHIRAFDVCRSIRGFGTVKADSILRSAGVDRRKYVDHLTGRQAAEIATQLMEVFERRGLKVAA
jgi:hypothetical protein